MENCFILLRSIVNTLFAADLELTHAKLVEHRDLTTTTTATTEEQGNTIEVEDDYDSRMRTLQQFSLQRILPLAGHWLQVLRTIALSLSDWETETLLVRLLRMVLTVFPLECVAAMESELYPLLRTFPRVAMEVADGEIQLVKMEVRDGRESLPTIMGM